MNSDYSIGKLFDECEEFGGDKAIFWAGRMSSLIASIQFNGMGSLVRNLDLLVFASGEYDKVVFSRTKPPF